jgi:hypothetical protein
MPPLTLQTGVSGMTMFKLETILLSFYTMKGTVQFQFSVDSNWSDFAIFFCFSARVRIKICRKNREPRSLKINWPDMFF